MIFGVGAVKIVVVIPIGMFVCRVYPKCPTGEGEVSEVYEQVSVKLV